MPRWARVTFLCCIYYVLMVGGNANHFSLKIKLFMPIARSLVGSDSVKISKGQSDIGRYGRRAKVRNPRLLKQIGSLPGWSRHCNRCNCLVLTWSKWPGAFSWENICLLPSCMNHCLCIPARSTFLKGLPVLMVISVESMSHFQYLWVIPPSLR